MFGSTLQVLGVFIYTVSISSHSLPIIIFLNINFSHAYNNYSHHYNFARTCVTLLSPSRRALGRDSHGFIIFQQGLSFFVVPQSFSPMCSANYFLKYLIPHTYVTTNHKNNFKDVFNYQYLLCITHIFLAHTAPHWTSKQFRKSLGKFDGHGFVPNFIIIRN